MPEEQALGFNNNANALGVTAILAEQYVEAAEALAERATQSFPHLLRCAEEHHELSHEGDDNADAKDKLTRINHWYAEQLAALIDRLKAASDGPGGSVFDNTIILWGNELGKGNSHSRDDAPYVLAGDAGGYFQTGRYLQYSGEPHNNLLLSLVSSCGIQQASFGNPEWCTGPLAGLV